jgi:ribonuclease PH
MVEQGLMPVSPVMRQIAAISVGVVDGVAMLDLNYAEDVRADVDMNVVMSSEKRFVEVQGTGERTTFGQEQLASMIALATDGITQLVGAQSRALAG